MRILNVFKEENINVRFDVQSGVLFIENSNDMQNAIKKIKDEGYEYLYDIFAIDQYPSVKRFRVNYILRKMPTKESLTISLDISEDETLPSISLLYSSAYVLEREMKEMFGIKFDADLAPLFLGGKDFYPLRKDFQDGSKRGN